MMMCSRFGIPLSSDWTCARAFPVGRTALTGSAGARPVPYQLLVLLDRLLLLLLDLLYLGVQPGPPPQEQEDSGNHQEGGEASGQEE